MLTPLNRMWDYNSLTMLLISAYNPYTLPIICSLRRADFRNFAILNIDAFNRWP